MHGNGRRHRLHRAMPHRRAVRQAQHGYKGLQSFLLRLKGARLDGEYGKARQHAG